MSRQFIVGGALGPRCVNATGARSYGVPGVYVAENEAAGQTITVPLSTLTLAALAPTLALTGNQTIAAPLLTLVLSALTPAVAATANQWVNVPLSALTISALTPGITATQNQFVVVPLSSLSLTSFVPTITNPQFVIAPLSTLAVSALAPTITATTNQFIFVPLSTLGLMINPPAVEGTFRNTSGVFSGPAGAPGPEREHRKMIVVDMGDHTIVVNSEEEAIALLQKLFDQKAKKRKRA